MKRHTVAVLYVANLGSNLQYTPKSLIAHQMGEVAIGPFYPSNFIVLRPADSAALQLYQHWANA